MMGQASDFADTLAQVLRQMDEAKWAQIQSQCRFGIFDEDLRNWQMQQAQLGAVIGGAAGNLAVMQGIPPKPSPKERERQRKLVSVERKLDAFVDRCYYRETGHSWAPRWWQGREIDWLGLIGFVVVVAVPLLLS
jgi:hypothetical protein